MKKPREFWILPNDILQWKVYSVEVYPSLPNDRDVIHAREVLPEEPIVIKGEIDTTKIKAGTIVHYRSVDWQSIAKELAEALDKAHHELGVTQPGYPYPVANANEIICEALAKYRELPK